MTMFCLKTNKYYNMQNKYAKKLHINVILEKKEKL